MSPTLILVLVLVAVAAIGLVVWYLARQNNMKRRYGPEYERLVAGFGRKAADRELRDRERRHAELDLREVPEDRRTDYINRWRQVETSFVDAPEAAVRKGEEIINRVIAEIGYPMNDEDETLAQLSVDHPRTLSGFRDARALTRPGRHGMASTEELRQALVQQRALVAELLDSKAEAGRTHA
ncbi:hypothetical protein Afil01_21940 [Actinorhabdospora filicis]|uniref:Secreted protein n=1 Tax=Actinorhabdospora filicis TaxID=1785913 RepID=A0A9W6SKA7_9ACTN|nr:hypothetical protein [Actinorhabdospora filicis]GLZ77387.1 hypothetical protein Afil01_21940 [Actinorhabdospora filicis]